MLLAGKRGEANPRKKSSDVSTIPKGSHTKITLEDKDWLSCAAPEIHIPLQKAVGQRSNLLAATPFLVNIQGQIAPLLVACSFLPGRPGMKLPSGPLVLWSKAEVQVCCPSCPWSQSNWCNTAVYLISSCTKGCPAGLQEIHIHAFNGVYMSALKKSSTRCKPVP